MLGASSSQLCRLCCCWSWRDGVRTTKSSTSGLAKNFIPFLIERSHLHNIFKMKAGALLAPTFSWRPYYHLRPLVTQAVWTRQMNPRHSNHLILLLLIVSTAGPQSQESPRKSVLEVSPCGFVKEQMWMGMALHHIARHYMSGGTLQVPWDTVRWQCLGHNWDTANRIL